MPRPPTFDTGYDAPYRSITARWRMRSPDGKAIFVSQGSEVIRVPRDALHGADEAQTLKLVPGATFTFRMLDTKAMERGLAGL